MSIHSLCNSSRETLIQDHFDLLVKLYKTPKPQYYSLLSTLIECQANTNKDATILQLSQRLAAYFETLSYQLIHCKTFNFSTQEKAYIDKLYHELNISKYEHESGFSKIYQRISWAISAKHRALCNFFEIMPYLTNNGLPVDVVKHVLYQYC